MCEATPLSPKVPPPASETDGMEVEESVEREHQQRETFSADAQNPPPQGSNLGMANSWAQSLKECTDAKWVSAFDISLRHKSRGV